MSQTSMDRDGYAATRRPSGVESGVAPQGSGVSWGAIVAGAAGAAALSLILLILGVGLGLSSVSPWSQEGLSAVAFGVSTILWLSFTQLAASGLGGYLAGRLRTRWSKLHGDEVYFRDTAHGFLAWALATLLTAGLLGSAVSGIISGGTKAGAALAGGATATAAIAAPAARAASGADPTSSALSYHVDALFRQPASPVADSGVLSSGAAAAVEPRTPRPAVEVGRIFANALVTGSLPAADAAHVGSLVAQHTGLPQVDAERRVGEHFARLQLRLREAEEQAKAIADRARKGTAYASLWCFVALLGGAFIASLAATFGGRQRDLS